MASTLWLSLCLLLFANNLMDLLNDRHQLSYKIVEQGDVFFDEDNDLNYMACIGIRDIKALDSLFYEPISQNATVRSILNHSIASIERRLNVTSLFHLNEGFIFKNEACFPTKKSELEEEGKAFNEFLKEYIFVSIFIYSKEKQPNFYEKAYLKEDNRPSMYLRIYKQKVFGANYLLNADCSNRANQIHHDRFTCLNRCFKELKMKWAFYRFDDEDIFDLRDILNETKNKKSEVNDEGKALEIYKKLQTINLVKGAENCLRRCPEKSCFWEVVIPLQIDNYYYWDYYLRKKGKQKVELQLNTYIAFYSMSDFHLQLFGLLALFTGTSVLRILHVLLSRTLRVAARKIEPLLRNEKLLRIFRLVISNLRHVPTLLGIVLVLFQSLVMVNEFRFHSSHPNKTSTLNFSSEPFSVVICFPILENGEDSSTIRNFSFDSIEEASKRVWDNRIESIGLFSVNERIESNFNISDEILFKSSKINDILYLSRCFRLNVDETHSIMPLAYLRIEFKTKDREIFLIERSQNFTSGLVNFRGLFNPQKVTKIYSKSSVKSNCRDYSGEESCNSRRNCLDRCLSAKFIEKRRSIPTDTVVSSSHLNSTMRKRSVYFNETVDREIEGKCSAFFNQTDCNEVRFEESPDRVTVDVNWLVFIRLSYLNIVEKEMEYDLVKTLLDIVGLETVLFGSNVLGVLTTVLLFLCKILRLKWWRAYSVFLLMVASIGFLVHNVLVFRAIISGDLHENEFFEKPERYSLPSPILCFTIGKEVDENHRVTGEYLDHLTGDLIFPHTFRAILYNNRTHDKVLYINRLGSTNSPSFYSSPELELSHFYYHGQKCFKTSLKVNYTEEDFFLLDGKIVLSIYLNRTFVNQTKFTIFLHQQADSKEIGGGFVYEIGKLKHDPDSYLNYQIEFEQFRIVREDQFELLKDPRRLFQERMKVDDASTEEVLRKRFEEDHNRTTDHLPLDVHFGLEVDNELYEQHAKTVTDQSPFQSLDFEQNVANAYANVHSVKFEYGYPHFLFSFSFLVRRVVITNSENYTKLVVSLLNTLSLWLDICVIDMGAWFSPIFKLFLNFYLLLIKTSNCLDRLRK